MNSIFCTSPRRRSTGSLLALAAILVLAGCRTTRDPHRVFPIDMSSLDWLEVVYNPSPEDKQWKSTCRLSIFATGMIMFRTGNSPQVMDDFSTDTDHADWQDFYQDSMGVTKEEMEAVLQAFVDAGLYIKEFRKPPPIPSNPPFAKFNGIISGDKIWRMSGEEDLMRVVNILLGLFERRYNDNLVR